MRPISNFGKNICFQPRRLYAPRTDDEILQILNDHRGGAIRVVGAGHSWNPGIASQDVLIDLKHIRHVHVNDDGTCVTAGAGVRIGALLKQLSRRGLTLPSLGLIDRQTIAGAVATGTHGSGRHSMSHYVERMRIACYGADGTATVRTVDSGATLRAARCPVGALGVVLEVTLPCVPQYYVRERCRWRPGLDAVLEREAEAPLQQFYIMPHAWTYLAHERRVAATNRRAGGAALYRVYWLVSHNHADSRLICTTGSRGRPGLLSARRGERSEPERALNRDGGRIDVLAGRKGAEVSVIATVLPNVLNGYTSIEARMTSTGEGKNA